MKAIFLVLALTLLTHRFSYAAEAAAPALSIQMMNDPVVDQALQKQLQPLLNAALNFVKMFPPKGHEDNAFAWSIDREILKGKSLAVSFSSTHSKMFAPLIGNVNMIGMDSFTLAPIDTQKNEVSIMVVLLVDEIFYDREGRERPDGFAKLVVALAHEFYGSVDHFLRLDASKAKVQTMADRTRQQRAAASVSILFLGELLQNPKFKTLPPSIQSGITGRMPNEISIYKSWAKANPSMAKDPACEAMLLSMKTGNDN